MLLKTKEYESYILTNATMLMKTNHLNSKTHDVHEKKGTCAPRRHHVAVKRPNSAQVIPGVSLGGTFDALQ